MTKQDKKAAAGGNVQSGLSRFVNKVRDGDEKPLPRKKKRSLLKSRRQAIFAKTVHAIGRRAAIRDDAAAPLTAA
jgi:hypothetical protein